MDLPASLIRSNPRRAGKPVPIDQIVMRYTQVLREKRDQFLGYRQAGLVAGVSLRHRREFGGTLAARARRSGPFHLFLVAETDAPLGKGRSAILLLCSPRAL